MSITSHRPDTYSSLELLNPSSDAVSTTYDFSSNGIAWPGESKKYAVAPAETNLSAIVPPPNWAKRYPTGYNSTNPPPNLKDDEHFQNWMRTAGLPTFTKLYGRNDNQTLTEGTYRVTVGLSSLFFLSPFRLSVLTKAHIDGYRLPSPALQRHKVHRHLDCIVDRGEEPVLGMGVCSCSSHLRTPCYCRDGKTPYQTKVCLLTSQSNLLFLLLALSHLLP